MTEAEQDAMNWRAVAAPSAASGVCRVDDVSESVTPWSPRDAWSPRRVCMSSRSSLLLLWIYLRLVSSLLISTTDVTTKPSRDYVVTAVSLRNCRLPREPAVSQTPSRPPAHTTVPGTAPRTHTHVELIQTARVVHRVVAGP